MYVFAGRGERLGMGRGQSMGLSVGTPAQNCCVGMKQCMGRPGYGVIHGHRAWDVGVGGRGVV